MPPKREPRTDDERYAMERDELASFERRDEWWRLHYGETDAVDAKTREAAEHAERMRRGKRAD